MILLIFVFDFFLYMCWYDSLQTSFWKVFISALACGCVLISFGILVRFYSPQILKARNFFEKYRSVSQTDTEPCQIQSLGVNEVSMLLLSHNHLINENYSSHDELVLPNCAIFLME